MTEIAEFPFDRLPRLTRHEAGVRSAWAASGPVGDLVGSAATLGELLGGSLSVDTHAVWERVSRLPAEAILPTALLEGPASVALTLDPAFADLLVARALGADAPPPSAGPLRDVERGVLAHVLGRWLSAGPWWVSAVLSHPAPLAYASLPLRWPLRARFANDVYHLDLWLPLDAPPVEVRVGPQLDHVPVELAVEIGDARLSNADVDALRAGDVVVPDRLSLDHEGSGSARLRALGLGWRAQATPDGWEIVARREEDAMSEEEVRTRAKGAPVTLSVELARIVRPLGEVAALAPGAVLRTDQPIGGTVTLRAHGEVLATGELVDVDGDVGVRILEVVKRGSTGS